MRDPAALGADRRASEDKVGQTWMVPTRIQLGPSCAHVAENHKSYRERYTHDQNQQNGTTEETPSRFHSGLYDLSIFFFHTDQCPKGQSVPQRV